MHSSTYPEEALSSVLLEFCTKEVLPPPDQLDGAIVASWVLAS